ncbi:MAG TPA: four helix bundle protein [Candidatus Paceibacterota bacterium]|nr:four helix bundle protein [Candidatus Paceibacterota bacterium]
MGIKQFEDIIAWQKAKILTVMLYRSVASSKDWGFRDQLQRAAVSVMNNIAEGYERQTNKDFRNFLYIAKGSCAEVRSMLSIAHELKILSPEECGEARTLSLEISRLLSGFIKKL